MEPGIYYTKFNGILLGGIMSKLVIISTLGASLLTNYALHLKKNPREFLEYIDSISTSEFESMKRDIIAYLRSLGDSFPRSSAELSSIVDILKDYNLSKYSEIELMFSVSDTKQGRLVIDVLKDFIEDNMAKSYGKIINVYRDIIEGLNYVDIEHATRGLPTLAARVAIWIRNHLFAGNDVIINVTGGFKAESIYVAFIGIIAGVPTYYMHEKFRKCILLPPFPSELFALSDKMKEAIFHYIKSFYDRFMAQYSKS